MPGVFDPLVPQSAIDPLQELLDRRRLDQSPLEAQVRGFGAGALEGLRGLTSPASLAGMIPGAGAARLLKFAHDKREDSKNLRSGSAFFSKNQRAFLNPLARS